MNRLLLFIALLGASQLTAGCQRDEDIRPANYDELALDTGHWEWDASTLGWAGNRTPATVGFTRQLVFGSGGRLTIRRRGQADYHTSYQLAMGLPSHCAPPVSIPLITYANEADLPNNPVKLYRITQLNGRQVLEIQGEAACVDGGAYETYHWVAE